MSHSRNSSSATDLMVLVTTTVEEDAYGWVVDSCEHSITLEVPDYDTDRPGWIVTIPWDQVAVLTNVTEFMTRTPATEDA